MGKLLEKVFPYGAHPVSRDSLYPFPKGREFPFSKEGIEKYYGARCHLFPLWGRLWRSLILAARPVPYVVLGYPFQKRRR